MTVYVVQYRYSEDSTSLDEHRPAHREFMQQLADEGVLLISGPWAGEGAPGALIVLQASSAELARGLMRDDPFQEQGLVEEVSVREWTPVKGALLGVFEGH